MVNKSPNIIMIVVHDLGTHLASYQKDPAIPSSNLDRLAKEGVRFENNFCTAPFCSPSRGSIITGKYPHENGLLGLVNLGWDIASSNLCLAMALKNSGYETNLIGHQHESRGSKKLGFDNVDETSCKCAEVAPRVCEFIEQKSEDNSKPFYCQIGFSEVHRTVRVFEHDSTLEPEIEQRLIPLPYLKDTPGLRKDMKNFYGSIQDMDIATGAILESLDKSPLKENTLLVFTTDHGIAFPRAKGTLYDAGINTTLIMRWPAGFKGGRVLKNLISNIDLFPTLLDVVGADVPENISGRSFLNLLQDKEYKSNKRIFAEKNSQPEDIKRCVRTERYKYIRNFNEGSRLSLPMGLKLSPTGLMMGDKHLSPCPQFELYDLYEDPHEQNNLSGKPEYTQIEKELSEALDEFMEKTNDPILSGPIVRPAVEKEKIENYYKVCKKHLMDETAN